jgi:lysyl-tRNA synthetase, class I
MAEKFFWADKAADDIIERNPKKKEYVCASGITPSGHVHIGNFREVITTDLVVRALKDKGKKVRFIYSWDDFDRFRKVPKNISEDYEKYLGMPLSEIPSPFGKGSYAEYFEKEFDDSLKTVGISPSFIRQSIMNKESKYAELIKIALEKKDKIKEIFDKYRKEPLSDEWLPVNVYCEKCMKDSTKILGFEGFEIEYECECGHRDKIDFRKKGLVKLVWRVDWPARWKYEEVDFEPGGIDHSSPGGSFTTAKEIIKEIYDGEIPLYQFYEWIKIKGGEHFSSSAGNATTLEDVGEVYEPEVLRYLFVGTRPNKGFQISFDNDIIKLYEDYDALEEKYFSGEANPQEKRYYEVSQIKLPSKKPERTSFRHLITLVQAGKIEDLTGADRIRAEKVKNWIENHAGDDMKFEIQGKINVELEDEEKEILRDLLEITKKDFDEERMLNGCYEISEKHNIKVPEFFALAYKVIINKERGPRLASLIISAKERIIKLLEQI